METAFKTSVVRADMEQGSSQGTLGEDEGVNPQTPSKEKSLPERCLTAHRSESRHAHGGGGRYAACGKEAAKNE